MNTMKKSILIASAALLLVGCKDAKAKLPGSNETVMTVGTAAVTKGDLYQMMFISGGASEVVNDANKVIGDVEIAVTDEMRENAKGTLDLYKMMYGDEFATMLEAQGMTEDDYVNELLIPSLQSEKLVGKYIEEHFDEITAAYDPIQATVLTFTTEDDAKAALSALRDGSKDAATAAKDNNSSSAGTPEIVTINTLNYDSSVLSVIRSSTPDAGWTMLPGMDGSSFYVLKVDSNNPADYKDDVIKSLSNVSDITAASTDYYFRKYGFHVYDIDLYNALKESNPNILVQSKPAPAPLPPASKPESTPAAAGTEASAAPEPSAAPEASASPEPSEAPAAGTN